MNVGLVILISMILVILVTSIVITSLYKTNKNVHNSLVTFYQTYRSEIFQTILYTSVLTIISLMLYVASTIAGKKTLKLENLLLIALSSSISGILYGTVYILYKEDNITDLNAQTFKVFASTLAATSINMTVVYFTFSDKMEFRNIIGISVVGLAFSGIIAVQYYSLKTQNKISTDTNSKNRLEQVDNVLTSYAGRNWAIILLLVALLIYGGLVIFYYSNRNSTINVDKKYVSWIALFLTIILGILGYWTFKKYRNQRAKDQADYGDVANITQGKQFLELLGVIFVGIIVLIIVLSQLMGGSKSSSNKTFWGDVINNEYAN